MKQTSSPNAAAKNKSKLARKDATPENRRRKVLAQKAKNQAMHLRVAEKKKVQTTVAPQVKAPEILVQEEPPVVETQSPALKATPEKVPQTANQQSVAKSVEKTAPITKPIPKPVAKPALPQQTPLPQQPRVSVAPLQFHS